MLLEISDDLFYFFSYCFQVQLLIIYLFSCVDERKELLLHK